LWQPPLTEASRAKSIDSRAMGVVVDM
jgi:hypothetical protein